MWRAWPHDYEPKAAPEDPDVPMEVTEEEFRHTLAVATQSGIDRTSGTGATNALQAAPLPDSSGVTVQPGFAQINGYSALLDAQDTVTAPANASALPRLYRVVIRHDVGARTAVAAILEGTPASSPQLPAVTRTDTIWEEPLGRFRRNGNGGPITSFQDDRVFLNPAGPLLCSSAARPVAPEVGTHAYELDTGRTILWDGSTWTTAADPAYPSAWQPIPLSAGYSNLAGEGNTPSYQLETPTRVRLRGSIGKNSGPIPNNAVIGRMPTGARPNAYTRQVTAAELQSSAAAFVRLTVVSVNATSNQPGQIMVGVIGDYTPEWVYLDGVVYDV
ncbi:hypothetical protein [Nocardiopsis trehalosi]|uniref:hypothetical protein n=1 Tax=Nocardiopsis trehalosi TaxID=109329 RepID=UPI00082FFCBB|nr:hypothetical protein [Nocardiopsis trehalosi]